MVRRKQLIPLAWRAIRAVAREPEKHSRPMQANADIEGCKESCQPHHVIDQKGSRHTLSKTASTRELAFQAFSTHKAGLHASKENNGRAIGGSLCHALRIAPVHNRGCPIWTLYTCPQDSRIVHDPRMTGAAGRRCLRHAGSSSTIIPPCKTGLFILTLTALLRQ